eukprot:NODE_1702_length_1842_cov_36.299593_g1443_i0.p1 GENE.NODE_1702_length_1842_cov_36.299593_g1443_i0~~NODE_1702_length_1842_cov_36.299593_g1443_i0.p1  ORF type:complete len:582 (-),score=108.39 NODE_1702_length_1842_cov_36.299593_g1443_i0:95-1789(-)
MSIISFLVFFLFFLYFDTTPLSIVGDKFVTQKFMRTVLKQNLPENVDADIIYAVGVCPTRLAISSFDGIFPASYYGYLYNGSRTRMIISMPNRMKIEEYSTICLLNEPHLRNIHTIWSWNQYENTVDCLCGACLDEKLLIGNKNQKECETGSNSNIFWILTILLLVLAFLSSTLLYQLYSEKNKYLSRYKELETINEELYERNNKELNRINDYEKANESHQYIKQLQIDIQNSYKLNADLELQNNESNAELKRTQEELEEERYKIKKLKIDIQNIYDENYKLSDELKIASDKYYESNAELKRTQEELEEERYKIKKLKIDIQNIYDENYKSNDELKKTIIELNKEKDKNKELNRINDKYEKANEIYKIEELKVELQNSYKEAYKLREDLNKVNNQNYKLKGEIIDHNNNLKRAEEENIYLKNELIKTKSKESQYDTNEQNLRQRLLTLNDHLNQVINKQLRSIHSLIGFIKKSQQEMTITTASYTEIQRELDFAYRKIGNLTLMYRELFEYVCDQREEILSLKNTLWHKSPIFNIIYPRQMFLEASYPHLEGQLPLLSYKGNMI